jgi:hypothetical protein
MLHNRFRWLENTGQQHTQYTKTIIVTKHIKLMLCLQAGQQQMVHVAAAGSSAGGPARAKHA